MGCGIFRKQHQQTLSAKQEIPIPPRRAIYTTRELASFPARRAEEKASRPLSFICLVPSLAISPSFSSPLVSFLFFPAASDTKMDDETPNVLLAGLICRGSVHLVVGTNPLAAARCAQSLRAGARPILVAPAATDLHYGLQAKINDGSVKWEQKTLEDGDLFRLGREEVGGVVDAVFLTTGSRDTSTFFYSLCLFFPLCFCVVCQLFNLKKGRRSEKRLTNTNKTLTSPPCASATAPSTSSTLPTSAPSPCCPPTPTGRSRSASRPTAAGASSPRASAARLPPPSPRTSAPPPRVSGSPAGASSSRTASWRRVTAATATTTTTTLRARAPRSTGSSRRRPKTSRPAACAGSARSASTGR